MGEEAQSFAPYVFGAIFALTSFVLGIIALLFRILAMIREVGRECHSRINTLDQRVEYEKGFREGRLSNDCRDS